MEEKRQRVRKILTAVILILGIICVTVGVVLFFGRPVQTVPTPTESAPITTSTNEEGFAQLPKKINK